MTGEPAFFELGVADAERGRRFYGALFGWEFQPGPMPGAYVIGSGSTPGGIHGGDPGGGPYLFFRVDDLDSALERVHQLGGTVEGAGADDDDPDGALGRFRMCRDDQGSPFGLVEPPKA